MENTILHLHESHKSQEIDKFSELISAVCHLGSLQGIPIKKASILGLDKLQQLEVENIRRRNQDLQRYLHVLQETILEKEIITNQNTTRSVLNFMKIMVPDSFVKTIAEDDIVEIYNLEGIQIFRNLKFYETTAYSLTDLLTHEWPELYYRSSKITEHIFSFIEKVTKDPRNDVVYDMSEVPVHIIKEIKANPIQLCEIRLKNISSVTNFAGIKTGFIVSCEAKNLQVEQKALDFI